SRDERPADRTRDDTAAEQQRSRRSGERQLAHPVHGEREIPLHDEDADESADDTEHRSGDDRVRQQRDERPVVLEREDIAPVDSGNHAHRPGHATSPCSPWSWCGSASGTPTTTRRSPARRTNTGVPYRSVSTRLCSTSSGVPSTNRPPAM